MGHATERVRKTFKGHVCNVIARKKAYIDDAPVEGVLEIDFPR